MTSIAAAVSERDIMSYDAMKQGYLNTISRNIYPLITTYIQDCIGNDINENFYRNFKKFLVDTTNNILQLDDKKAKTMADVIYDPTLRNLSCLITFRDIVNRIYEFRFVVKL